MNLPGQRDGREALTDLQTAITGKAPTGQEYFLLGFDSRGQRRSDRVDRQPRYRHNTAVFVPGTGTDLASFTDEYGTLARAETMAYDAQRLGGNEETAVIAWFDYDAPNEPVPEAGDLSYAEAAGARSPSSLTGSRSLTTGLNARTRRWSDTLMAPPSSGIPPANTASRPTRSSPLPALAWTPTMPQNWVSALRTSTLPTAEGDAIRHTTDTLSWVAQAAAEGITGGKGGVDWDAQGDGPFGLARRHQPDA